MAEFVNYNKRSIQLPPGCKDLGDLFKPAWLRNLPKSVAPPKVPVILRNDSFVEKLGNVEKYVAMLFDSRADGCDLIISSPDEKHVLTAMRTTDSITSYVSFPDYQPLRLASQVLHRTFVGILESVGFTLAGLSAATITFHIVLDAPDDYSYVSCTSELVMPKGRSYRHDMPAFCTTGLLPIRRS